MTITRPGHKGTATNARQEVELTRSRKLREVLGEEAQQRQRGWEARGTWRKVLLKGMDPWLEIQTRAWTLLMKQPWESEWDVAGSEGAEKQRLVEQEGWEAQTWKARKTSEGDQTESRELSGGVDMIGRGGQRRAEEIHRKWTHEAAPSSNTEQWSCHCAVDSNMCPSPSLLLSL